MSTCMCYPVPRSVLARCCRREGERQDASYLRLRFCVRGLRAGRGDGRGLGMCSGFARMMVAMRSLKSSTVSTGRGCLFIAPPPSSYSLVSCFLSCLIGWGPSSISTKAPAKPLARRHLQVSFYFAASICTILRPLPTGLICQ